MHFKAFTTGTDSLDQENPLNTPMSKNFHSSLSITRRGSQPSHENANKYLQ